MDTISRRAAGQPAQAGRLLRDGGLFAQVRTVLRRRHHLVGVEIGEPDTAITPARGLQELEAAHHGGRCVGHRFLQYTAMCTSVLPNRPPIRPARCGGTLSENNHGPGHDDPGRDQSCCGQSLIPELSGSSRSWAGDGLASSAASAGTAAVASAAAGAAAGAAASACAGAPVQRRSSSCGMNQVATKASAAIGTAIRNTVWIDSAYPATKPSRMVADRWLSTDGVTSALLKPFASA